MLDCRSMTEAFSSGRPSEFALETERSVEGCSSTIAKDRIVMPQSV